MCYNEYSLYFIIKNKGVMKQIISKALGLLGLVTLPALTLAQSDYNYDYNYDTTTSTTSDAAGAAFGIGMLLFIGFVSLIFLALFVLWVVMLIDCVKRQFEARTTWLIVLIVGLFIGYYPIAAIVYYFMVKRKNLGTKPGATAAPKA